MDILITIIAACCALLFSMGIIVIGKKGIEDIAWFWKVGDYGWCFSTVVIVVLIYSIAALSVLIIYSKLMSAI